MRHREQVHSPRLPYLRHPTAHYPASACDDLFALGVMAYLADAKPPCKEEGKEDAYTWKGACYMPSYPAGRAPTSAPP